MAAIAYLTGGVLSVGGSPVPIKMADNEDGTFSIEVGAALTLDPTNLATSAKQDSEAVVIGTVADAAWSGTGDATVIALLKKIALNTAPA